MKLDNTDFSRQKSEAERKKEKIKDIKTPKMSGSSRAAPTTKSRFSMWPWPAPPASRSSPCRWSIATAPSSINRLPVTSQLDDYIAIVVLDGKDVYLDPGQKMCPFGLLHWKHTSRFRIAPHRQDGQCS